MTDPSLLSVERVSKRLGHKRVLREASLTLRPGEVCALLGANGAGKSTLLRIVAGVLAPDAGDVRIGGISLRRRRAEALAKLGYAPEHADFPDFLRGSEWLALVAALKRAPPFAAEEVAPLGLSGFVDQRLGSLSLGQRRRVALAAGLVGSPPLLVFDEPTNGLDAASLSEVGQLFADQLTRGGSVLFATHDAAFASRVGARRVRVDGGELLEVP